MHIVVLQSKNNVTNHLSDSTAALYNIITKADKILQYFFLHRNQNKVSDFLIHQKIISSSAATSNRFEGAATCDACDTSEPEE